MRYFHGSSARLMPGDVLVPGTQIGTSVHQISEHVYAAAGDGIDEVLTAIELAFEFGSYAADLFCVLHAVEDGELAFDHADHFTVQITQDCVYVYEIEPIGEVESDPAEDFTTGASVRMGSAVVLARVDAEGDWLHD